MYKILAIGNSFSDDSTAYLEALASKEGIEVKVVSLFIGACSLERHWDNVRHNRQVYDYRRGGQSMGRMVSISEAIEDEDWNLITLQQYSGHSGVLGTYYPFVEQLYYFIKKKSPGSRIMMHQTWAYEQDSDHDDFSLYHHNQKEMFHRIMACYQEVAMKLQVPIIPFGEVIQKIRENSPFLYEEGGYSLCRDGHHMNEVFGRYALALTWYGYVLKGDVSACSYYPDVEGHEALNDKAVQCIKDCVETIIQRERTERI